MMPKNLLLMSGPSGAGKSHWAKEFAKTHKCNYISRDEVRFELVKENEDYFSHEDEVFTKWINQIQNCLNHADEETWVIADATHLSERSRNKTLNHLRLDGVKIWVVFFNPGVEVCLKQNENRTGRSKVPRSVIRRLCFQYEPPHEGEKYKYEGVYEIVRSDK